MDYRLDGRCGAHHLLSWATYWPSTRSRSPWSAPRIRRRRYRFGRLDPVRAAGCRVVDPHRGRSRDRTAPRGCGRRVHLRQPEVDVDLRRHLILPPPLAIAVIALSYLHSWARLRRSPPHRGRILRLHRHPRISSRRHVSAHHQSRQRPRAMPGGSVGLIAVTAAALPTGSSNYSLVVGAVLLSNPEANARKALGQLSDQFIVAGALGLGTTNCGPAGVPAMADRRLADHGSRTAPRTACRAVPVRGAHGLRTLAWRTRCSGTRSRPRNWSGHRTRPPARRSLPRPGSLQERQRHDGHLAGDQVLKAIAAN